MNGYNLSVKKGIRKKGYGVFTRLYKYLLHRVVWLIKSLIHISVGHQIKGMIEKKGVRESLKGRKKGREMMRLFMTISSFFNV